MSKWTDEQLDAINSENQNIIVSAGAGSGKTAVLSERVLRKVTEGVSVTKLLILTFTNAAASEMKERIRTKLKQENLNEEAAKIDSSYITTFDSYALSIVKKYNYVLNISKDINIIDMGMINLKKEELLNEIFNKYYENENDQFLKLVTDFCVKDDDLLKEAILNLNEKLNLRYDKNKYLKEYLKNNYNEEYISNKINQFEKILFNDIEQIKIMLYKIKDSDYLSKIESSLNNLINCKKYDEIKNNIDVKLPNSPKNNEEIKEIRTQISELIKKISKELVYNDTNEIKETIYLTKNYVEIIIEIILELDKEINKYKENMNSYEFIDIAKMAIDIVSNNEDIRKELKEEYNEIMLDEYQDTNDLQENFIKLIENNNVYMVGDIKQSVYRFRNANPNIFKNKYDKYSKNDNGKKIDLNKNFRSRNEVLDNINLIFNLIMDDNIGAANYKETHQMIFGNKTYIENGKTNQINDMEILEYPNVDDFSKEEIEIFTVANDIKKKIENKYQIFDKDDLKLRNIKYSDFVILMDRSTNFDLYKKIFEYMSIPLTICKDESITINEEIYLIKNIINLIERIETNQIDEKYTYYFMSIARSYLFNIDDNSIFKTIKNKNYDKSEIIVKLKGIIDYSKTKTLKEIIEKIIEKFSFYKKIITVGNIENRMLRIEYLIQLASNLMKNGYDINQFREYLNNISEKKYNINVSLNRETNNSVRIMTIHKSKGLEFHICYFTGLYSKFNKSDIKERFIYDDTYGIITDYNKEGIGSTIYKTLLKDKYIKEEISEKIRLFYVALTRAKEKMIMLLPNKDRETFNEKNILIEDYNRLKYNSFEDILESIYLNIEDYVHNVDIDKLKLTKDYKFNKNSNTTNYDIYTDSNFKIDELNVKDELKENKTFSKKQLSLHSVSTYENLKFGLSIHEDLEYENLDENHILNNLITNDVINYYKEYEFMYIEENIKYHGIIDLLIEYIDHIKIVDYKLKNIEDENYINQLKGYKNYIEKIVNKKVKIYLYSISEEEIKEIE